MPNQNLTISKASVEDAKAISDLILSLSDRFIVDYEKAWSFKDSINYEAELSYLSSPRFNYYKLVRRDDMIGLIATRDTSHLFHFFIANEFQGRGMGSMLWRHLLDQLPNSCKTLTVNASINAVPIYMNYGFTPVSEPQDTHGIRFIPMSLKLV